MANINAHLPAALATPFHPPTENLQHDNTLKQVIPKPEIISSYTKLRDEEDRSQYSTKSHHIIQADDANTESLDHEASAERRRAQFFAHRIKKITGNFEIEDASLLVKGDFKKIMSVIEVRYKNAVTPLSEPNIQQAV